MSRIFLSGIQPLYFGGWGLAMTSQVLADCISSSRRATNMGLRLAWRETRGISSLYQLYVTTILQVFISGHEYKHPMIAVGDKD